MGLTIDQALQQAIEAHKAGKLQDAEGLYRAILQAQPYHPDANHNLGVLAVHVKKPAAGLLHFKTALEANPTQIQYWISYIDGLIQAGQLDFARQVLDQGKHRGLKGEALEALTWRLEGREQTAKNQNISPDFLSEPQSVSSSVSSRSEIKNQTKFPKLDKSVKSVSSIRKKHPHPQDINALATLFAEGRYTQATVAAQTMTECFPLHGFGWNVLGATLAQMGRYADALEPLQQAITLLQNDYMAHSNFGIALQNLGRFTEAEASHRRALQINPRYADAHFNLGTTLRELGRPSEAEASLRLALKIKRNYAEAHNNLGNILKDLDRSSEAESSYQQAVKIKPDYAEAHCNLGIALQKLGKLTEAEASHRRALQIMPDFAEAHCGLGIALHNRGRLYESEASFRLALQIKPDYAEAHNNLGHTLCALSDLGRAVVTYQAALDIDPTDVGLDAAVSLAVLYYLDVKIDQCRSKLIESQSILAMSGIKHHMSRAYWRYLNSLLSWHQQYSPKNNQLRCTEILYVIGESHSLSAHGVVVRYRDREMRCKAEWISGCKQWHLGNDLDNQYKRQFEAIMSRLPEGSTFLLTIGEIDCRLNTGILKACKKYPNMSLAEVIQATIKSYINYVSFIRGRYRHKVIVGGVPCTHLPLEALKLTEAEQLVQVISIFNKTLKGYALDAGMDFLDVFALTDRGDGIASGEWHIDDVHLLPSAFEMTFDRYCFTH